MIFEKQQFQIDCVNSIVDLLKDVDFDKQDFSSLPTALQSIKEERNYVSDVIAEKKQLDVLMETGTGKTFTYLQSIFELNDKYKLTKFIIVVPRTAIKMSVIQNIKLTKEYFFNIYQKHLNYIDYPAEGTNKIRQDFINSNELSIILITNSSFNGENNLINQTAEDLFEDGTTWKGIARKNPVVIIDEPHLLKGNRTTEYLNQLNAFTIRFGATYPMEEEHHLSNVSFSLNSVDAFNEFLVKRIRVHTLIQHSELKDIKVTHIDTARKLFSIVYTRNDQLQIRNIRLKDDLGAKTGIPAYQGVSVTKILKSKISLSDKTILEPSTGGYTLEDGEIRSMIRKTIDSHFKHEEYRFSQGIKTLSLFFIPGISEFRSENPTVKNIFEEEYSIARKTIYSQTKNQEYKAYLEQDFDQDGTLCVHEGYFSGDKGSLEKQEADGVNLILNDKQKLLSLDTPLRFIFSVWALQEGWDNPNVFNICKLASTARDTSRRQQVGRGLRIAVNKHGKRLTHAHFKEDDDAFYKINTLDVIVSGKEKDFIEQIQSEIQSASKVIIGDVITPDQLEDAGLNIRETSKLICTLEDEKIIRYNDENDNFTLISSGRSFLEYRKDKVSFLSEESYNIALELFSAKGNRITDGNKKPAKVGIRKEQAERFKALWETINKQSTLCYKDIDDAEIIKKVSNAFLVEKIDPVQNIIQTQRYDSQFNSVVNVRSETQVSDAFFSSPKAYSNFILQFARDRSNNLPMPFVLQLFQALGKKGKELIGNNPKYAQSRLQTIIKETIHESILQKVDYAFDNAITIFPNKLQKADGTFHDSIKHTELGRFWNDEEDAPIHNLYDKLAWDSNIEREIQENDPEEVDGQHITVIAKLPKINIPTPYKTYNPDFAYLITHGDTAKQLFLIVETKGYEAEAKIPHEEKQKIAYARKFFTAMQAQHPDIEISYQTRINRTDLSQLLADLNQPTA